MKKSYMPVLGGLSLLLAAGCMSSSRVQEMIDASHRDYLEASKAHEASINVLKQSSVTALEQNEQQDDELAALQKQLEATLAQIKPIQGNTEAAKVMSAANTVKVAELADVVQANKEAINETAERMATIDRLFEEVMITHYRKIADSAIEAIATLQADDVATTNGISSGLAEPIEIVAPATVAATDSVSAAESTNGVPAE
jgi:hypothetical protein